MQPRLAALVHAIQASPSMTAMPEDVDTRLRLGRCNPSSAEQVGQCRDSNGAKPPQTGQTKARTAGSAWFPHRKAGGAVDGIDDGHVLDRVLGGRLKRLAA